MADLPKTKVEFVNTRVPGSVHIVNEVRVNGSVVNVVEDGIDIEYGANVPTVVTLKLIVSEVHFNSAEPKRNYPTGNDHVHEAMKIGGVHNA